MHRDKDRYKAFSRRVAILVGGKVALVSALVARMYYLQVVDADRYVTMAEDNRINLRLLPPPRGRIVDRFGRAMADNQQNYRVLVVSEETNNLDETLDALAAVIPMTEHDRARIHRDAKRRRSFVPVTVRENLDWEDVARIEVNTPDLPGVMIDVGESRRYLNGELAAHVLGYVAAVSEADLEEQDDPLLELPGFRVGKSGIERTHDLALRGKAGNSQVEVNAVGRVIRELDRTEGQPGAELVLTLDLDLQKYAADRLGEESAAAVVMDIHTGDLLAMASVPSYDPSAFNKGLSGEEWKSLATNPKGPLINKAIGGQYAPGSTFKVCVALAALESGIINTEHTVFCPGHMELGDARFHCWKKGGHGALNLHGAISHSCDVFFYDVSRRIGIDRIAEMAKRLGLGQVLDIDLPGERPGLIPTRAWKKATLGQPWVPGENLIAAIGQGYVLATPLQLAVMAARICNGGRAVKPHLTRDLVLPDSVSPRPEPNFALIGINPKNLEAVIDGMIAVTSAGGTAYSARIPDPAMAMAGKTGTSQVRRISRAERDTGVRKNEDLPWKERDHALFIGFAPISEPRYSCAVVVEHGGGGSAVAAPIARDILIETQKRDPSRTLQPEQLAAAKGEGRG